MAERPPEQRRIAEPSRQHLGAGNSGGASPPPLRSSHSNRLDSTRERWLLVAAATVGVLVILILLLLPLTSTEDSGAGNSSRDGATGKASRDSAKDGATDSPEAGVSDQPVDEMGDSAGESLEEVANAPAQEQAGPTGQDASSAAAEETSVVPDPPSEQPKETEPLPAPAVPTAESTPVDNLENDAATNEPQEVPDEQRFLINLGRKPARKPPSGAFAQRDEVVRKERLAQEGGSEETEEAVSLGLAWLAAHQESDGSWSLDRFDHTKECNKQCSHVGTLKSDAAATALALLPFLAAGHTPEIGEYSTVVERGVSWLISRQAGNGDLSDRTGTMYSHGLAAIVLCEVHGMSSGEEYEEAAQRSVDFIVEAQHERGGWRYSPGQAGDTSVTGWQIMALRSAELSELKVPAGVISGATQFLDSVTADQYGGQYGYTPGDSGTPTMTAEGLLCRQMLGWKRDHRGITIGAQYLASHRLNSQTLDPYYVYYAAQVLHHFGGTKWREWNDEMREVVLELQEKEGHEAGSWFVPGGHGTSDAGRLYVTALMICTLEVYYRHAPLYQQQATTR